MASLALVALAMVPSYATAAARSNEAHISDLKQECVTAGLAMPQIVMADMLRPGKVKQDTYITLRYEAMPEACHGAYGRIGIYQVRLQDSKRPKRLFVLFSWNDNLFPYTRNEAGENGGVVSSIGHGEKWQLYHCRKGPAVTKAWVQLKNQVKDKRTGQIVAQRISKTRIKVHGAC